MFKSLNFASLILALSFALSSSASLETDLSGEWGLWVSESGDVPRKRFDIFRR